MHFGEYNENKFPRLACGTLWNKYTVRGWYMVPKNFLKDKDHTHCKTCEVLAALSTEEVV